VSHPVTGLPHPTLGYEDPGAPGYGDLQLPHPVVGFAYPSPGYTGPVAPGYLLTTSESPCNRFFPLAKKAFELEAESPKALDYYPYIILTL
jgi:hypothetical protein